MALSTSTTPTATTATSSALVRKRDILRDLYDDESISTRQKRFCFVQLQKICLNLEKTKYHTIGPRMYRRLLNSSPTAIEYLITNVGFQKVEERNGRKVFLRLNETPDRAHIRQHVRDTTRILILADPSRFMAADYIAVRDNFTWEYPTAGR